MGVFVQLDFPSVYILNNVLWVLSQVKHGSKNCNSSLLCFEKITSKMKNWFFYQSSSHWTLALQKMPDYMKYRKTTEEFYFQMRLHYKFGPIVRLLAYGRLNWLRPRFYWNLLRSRTSQTFHDEFSHDVRLGGQQILFCYCGYNIFLDTRWVI